MAAPAYGTPQHDQSLSDFKKRWQPAKDNQAAYAKKWRHNYDVYMGANHEPLDSNPDKSQLYVKHVHQQINAIVPKLVKPDPKFEFMPRQQAWQENASVARQLTEYQLDRDRFATKQAALVLPALIYGLTVGKVVWDYRVDTITQQRLFGSPEERLQAIAAQEPVTERKRVELYNDPTLIVVDPFDFFWDPAATTMDDARYACHRSFLTLDDLNAKLLADGSQLYQNLDRIPQAGGGSDQGDKRLSSETSEEQKARRASGKIEVVEMWFGNRLLVVANEGVVIRDEDNPFWHKQLPFVACFTQYDLNKFVGVATTWAIENLQDAIWTMENQRIDAVTLTLDPVLLVDRNMDGARDIVFGRGKRILVDNAEQVKQLQITAMGQPAARAEVDAFIGYMQTVSGVNPAQMASDSGGPANDTATGAALASTEQSEGIGLKLMNVQAMYARIAELFLLLSQQFISQDRAIQIVGPEGKKWVKVAPELIAGMYDVRDVSTTESINNSLMRQSAMELLNTLMPLTQPGPTGQPYTTPDGRVVTIEPALRKLIESHDLEPDEFFINAPPPPPPPPDPPPPLHDTIAASLKYADLAMPPASPAQAQLLQLLGLNPGPIVPQSAPVMDAATGAMGPGSPPTGLGAGGGPSLPPGPSAPPGGSLDAGAVTPPPPIDIHHPQSLVPHGPDQ